MAKYIYERLKEGISGFFTGKLSVTLGESHLAWAGYSDAM